jgi:YD repeat-containing protein
MLPAAKEEILSLLAPSSAWSGGAIFSLAAGVAPAALETHPGTRTAQGKKPHQGVFRKNRALRVSGMWAKWLGTHQDSEAWWRKTASGSALDANGNTLSDPSGKQYSWDFENRLTQAIVPGTGTTTFRYDPFGRRIQKSGPLGTTNYLYDAGNILGEVDSSGNVVARYMQGENVDEPFAELRSGTTSYYHPDGLGSITSLTNSSGTTAASYAYDAFGNLSASTGSLTNPELISANKTVIAERAAFLSG